MAVITKFSVAYAACAQGASEEGVATKPDDRMTGGDRGHVMSPPGERAFASRPQTIDGGRESHSHVRSVSPDGRSISDRYSNKIHHADGSVEERITDTTTSVKKESEYAGEFKEQRVGWYNTLSDSQKKEMTENRQKFDNALKFEHGEDGMQKTRDLLDISFEMEAKLVQEFRAIITKGTDEFKEKKDQQKYRDVLDMLAEREEKEGEEKEEKKEGEKVEKKELSKRQKAFQILIDSSKMLKAHPRPEVHHQFGYAPQSVLYGSYIMLAVAALIMIITGLVSPAPKACSKPANKLTQQDKKNIARYNGSCARCTRVFVSVLFWTTVCLAYFQACYTTFLTDLIEFEAFQWKVALGLYNVEIYNAENEPATDLLHPLGTRLVSEMELDVQSARLVKKGLFTPISNREEVNLRLSKSESALPVTTSSAYRFEEVYGEDCPLLSVHVTRDATFIPQRPLENWYAGPVLMMVVWGVFSLIAICEMAAGNSRDLDDEEDC